MTDIVLNIRDQFPILHQKVHGHPLIYFDNAATSQKPLKVINAISEYYQQENSNIHRGAHYLSNQATEKYEKSREAVRRFINAESTEEIILTKGTTESINLVASCLSHSLFKHGDEILISTNKGRVIRVAVKEIRTAGRNTQGVRIIKLSGDEKVVSADKIDDNLV